MSSSNEEFLKLVSHLKAGLDEGDNYGYVEAPSLDDIKSTWNFVFSEAEDIPRNKWGLPEYPIGEPFNEKTVEEFERKKEMEMTKPKAEYCDLCGKQYKQIWDSVTGKYYSPDKLPFIDKFVCGSCAFKAREWFYKQKNGNQPVIEQEEIEIKLEPKEEPKKKVDKTSVSCDNCLYKARGVKLKCNTCETFSNFKENYA